MTLKSVLKWIDETRQIGATVGMKDTPHRPRKAVIEASAIVIWFHGSGYPSTWF
jgi:hypothetical protein